jgi:hypothetical protein
MAKTPEAKVKAHIHAALKAAGAYAVNYIGGVMGNNGTPDILACLDGRFVGIEAKAGRGKPTALQVLALKRIDEVGGLALVVNENSLDYLKECLSNVRQARSNWHEFASILERAQASPD